jgi:hypothetical protein
MAAAPTVVKQTFENSLKRQVGDSISERGLWNDFNAIIASSPRR